MAGTPKLETVCKKTSRPVFNITGRSKGVTMRRIRALRLAPSTRAEFSKFEGRALRPASIPKAVNGYKKRTMINVRPQKEKKISCTKPGNRPASISSRNPLSWMNKIQARAPTYGGVI